MNILFFWPWKTPISTSATEAYEFYSSLKKMDTITLVYTFEEADYVFYMMGYRNILDFSSQLK